MAGGDTIVSPARQVKVGVRNCGCPPRQWCLGGSTRVRVSRSSQLALGGSEMVPPVQVSAHRSQRCALDSIFRLAEADVLPSSVQRGHVDIIVHEFTQHL